jgi:hypothetical protein
MTGFATVAEYSVAYYTTAATAISVLLDYTIKHVNYIYS